MDIENQPTKEDFVALTAAILQLIEMLDRLLVKGVMNWHASA